MYNVRINAENIDSFKLVNFSRISEGVIVLKAPRDIHLVKGQEQPVKWNFSINSFINGSESVGMAFFSNAGEMNGANKVLYFKNNRIKGYLDNLILKIGISTTANTDRVDIPYGTELVHIKYVSKEFNDLVLEKRTNGIVSSSINIEIYVGGKFKPFSNEQALAKGISLVKSSHRDGCKFYERDYVSSSLNSDEWIDCSL